MIENLRVCARRHQEHVHGRRESVPEGATVVGEYSKSRFSSLVIPFACGGGGGGG